MDNSVRTTVYLQEAIYKALRLKAAETNKKMSEIVNQALKQALMEDLEDIQDIDDRKAEPSRPFEDFIKELKSNGQL
jgi:hypothetical protein